MFDPFIAGCRSWSRNRVCVAAGVGAIVVVLGAGIYAGVGVVVVAAGASTTAAGIGVISYSRVLGFMLMFAPHLYSPVFLSCVVVLGGIVGAGAGIVLFVVLAGIVLSWR
jgi:hypothetical protein